MGKKVALVFGATGLVGRSIVEELCKSDDYSSVKIFARKESGLVGPDKTEEHIISFDNLENYAELLKGNELYICTGTTIKKAGTVKRMEEIDRDLPVRIASIASGNGVEKLAVVSSIGAKAGSSNYYLRIKGEMENGLMNLKFKTIIIARPSILLGKRSERRAGEEFSKIAMKVLGVFLAGKLSKYRGIEGKDVASAMVRATASREGVQIIESDELRKLA
jgi:uncharacterized protein YbjT (DUF2867 family)